VSKTGNPIVVPHISGEPRFLNKTRALSKHDDEDSFICIPVKTKNLIIGTSGVKLRFLPESSLKRELQILTVVASIFAMLARSRQDRIEEYDRLRYQKLRERRSDIPLFVNHFIEKYNMIHSLEIKRISSTAIDLLMTYH
jgi:Nif-specific regulatory protein